jgi:hypothetical protein
MWGSIKYGTQSVIAESVGDDSFGGRWSFCD